MRQSRESAVTHRSAAEWRFKRPGRSNGAAAWPARQRTGMTWSRSATSNCLTAWEALVFNQFIGPPPTMAPLTSPSGGGLNTWRATGVSAERAASAAGHEEQQCLSRPAASARSAQRSLTPRSSRAPTAGHQAPATGTVYIFCRRGLASHRRCRLNSNVRLRKASRAVLQQSQRLSA